jgi:gluconokinase
MVESAAGRVGRAIVVMGVSAAGKTSAGQAVAARFGLDFVDGDNLHPARNVTKMAGGTPLTDEDRWPWLDRIGDTLADRAAHPEGVVIACSALRRIYRDRIRSRSGEGVVFVFLDIGYDEACRRIAARQNHYMPPSLIDSQFQTLERPEGEADVVTISRLDSVEDTADQAIRAIEARAAEV